MINLGFRSAYMVQKAHVKRLVQIAEEMDDIVQCNLVNAHLGGLTLAEV